MQQDDVIGLRVVSAIEDGALLSLATTTLRTSRRSPCCCTAPAHHYSKSYARMHEQVCIRKTDLTCDVHPLYSEPEYATYAWLMPVYMQRS